jgi:EH domain-containing protein 1
MTSKNSNEYGEALRSELVEMVQDYLSPVALRYGYSQIGLDSTIRWRPLILILGNYSSGKSTLINEFVGQKIQATGQAPTDDSFTVITGGSGNSQDEREGWVLLNDPAYPFEILKRHGQRFAAHFRLKQVASSLLQDVAIVDTPGMLDSVAERDRGYNYQEVLSDLAQIADLIVVMFDPHKAGTIRESYQSLRQTLPDSTFEDRIVFVLNRIDECENFSDLLRVYGTLCWNLSQMIGRKDIPRIMMSYSESLAKEQNKHAADFLKFVPNDRPRLLDAIKDAPRHRLDHLAGYIEMHGERICHFLEALVQFHKRQKKFWWQHLFKSAVVACLAATVVFVLAWSGILIEAGQNNISAILASAIGVLAGGFWMGPIMQAKRREFRRIQFNSIDQLTDLATQARHDSWVKISGLVRSFLEKNSQNLPIAQIKQDLRDVRNAYKRSSKAAREALHQR